MRFLFQLFIVFFIGFGIAHAQQQQPRLDAIDIVEKGIYEARQVARIPTPENENQGRPKNENQGGPVKLITDVQLVQETTTIPGRVGLRFGFRYRPVGNPLGAVSSLRLTVRLPGQGSRDAPSTPSTPVRRTIGDIHLFGYTFDSPGEVVPGPWVFEIWQDDRKIVEQKFDVVRAK